ncbi:MAG: permease prefix domain 2-containing transporter [Bacteroidota bacterium]
MVAALHDQAYGVLIMESLEEKLRKKFNISAVHVALKRLDDKGFVKSRFGRHYERSGRTKEEVLRNNGTWQESFGQPVFVAHEHYHRYLKYRSADLIAPPKYAVKFLRWFCREDCLEEIEGNLTEIFEEDYKRSPAQARRNFRRNVIRHFRASFHSSL